MDKDTEQKYYELMSDVLNNENHLFSMLEIHNFLRHFISLHKVYYSPIRNGDKEEFKKWCEFQKRLSVISEEFRREHNLMPI